MHRVSCLYTHMTHYCWVYKKRWSVGIWRGVIRPLDKCDVLSLVRLNRFLSKYWLDIWRLECFRVQCILVLYCIIWLVFKNMQYTMYVWQPDNKHWNIMLLYGFVSIKYQLFFHNINVYSCLNAIWTIQIQTN